MNEVKLIDYINFYALKPGYTKAKWYSWQLKNLLLTYQILYKKKVVFVTNCLHDSVQ